MKLFLSHSSSDDAFVRNLRAALADHGQQVWIDSRELRGGDLLWPAIAQAIEEASAYAVLVSPEGLQSKWVGKELRHALAVQEKRGRDIYPVIPLSLDGTKLGVLEEFFDGEPLYRPVSSAPGGIEAAIHDLLVALSRRLPTDPPPMPQPRDEPLEELVLELTDLTFHEEEGVRRAAARARLIYEPATPGQPHVHSAQPWRLIAPIGPIEAEELRWYLEQYAIWPSDHFKERARKVEASLVEWGHLLHQAAVPPEHTANVMQAWAGIDARAGRRFSVHVDTALLAGAPENEIESTKEAATLLLGLPWELLHDGRSYLFQGGKPARVRRRLPATEGFDVPVVATPIRILLVTARPEDEACAYIDHRASALPLVEAMEALPGLVEIRLLRPPTLAALRTELERARDEGRPYQVVHFDGHGVYDRTVGLGGLCFERPEDAAKLEQRRHLTVYSNELGPLLRDHRIPLVFLEACQGAKADQAAESVASELLKVGVASVVAMSHSVLVETARRFVAAFYQALAEGKRVGDAMLAGQRQLKGDTLRGQVFGAGELRLEDWFVPVLFQEKEDPRLFRHVPETQTVEDFKAALAARLGGVPPEPQTGFVGRSRELLALQRLLGPEGGARYAVVRGQGGEGKTALAAELARWLVRSQQLQRVAFVSVEGLETNAAESVLDQLGQRLVHPGFATQIDYHGELEQAEQAIERALREQPTLLVLDNMESLLLPPFLAQATADALTEEARAELEEVLALCARLLKRGETRLLFTSREALPAPFDAVANRRELHRLAPEDGVKLVERVLNAAGGDAANDVEREAIERLVDAVQGHARTLALLAPSLQSRGVEATRESLVERMAEMERRFPGSREQSLFASVELSLDRLSEDNRKKARVLGVFHGGGQLGLLRAMMQWEDGEVAALASELIQTGLATSNPYDHLSLNSALCPYLHARLEPAERKELSARWTEAMGDYVRFLVRQRDQNSEVAATLTRLELPGLFALLDRVQRAGDAEMTIDLATSLYGLLQWAGKPRLLERVGQVRDAAAQVLGENLGETWTQARFNAAGTHVEQLLATGQLQSAFDSAQRLLERARAVGKQAYAEADYDLAMACFLLARVLKNAGGAEQALPLLDEARRRFEDFSNESPNVGAERMASVCLAEQGDCLRHLGRFDAAAAAYEENIQLATKLGDDRQIAVGKGQLGSVRRKQGRYGEALAAYQEARERFMALGEPGSVATIWHQTGVAYEKVGEPEAAEDAYRQSLAIEVRLGNVAGQAATLGQLGNLYHGVLNRTEEAVAFYRQAADKYVEIGDLAGEGVTRNNLAESLRKLGRIKEARREIHRALECKARFGHSATPWTSWSILAEIEVDAGDPAAARARTKARDCYLSYRRDGGENHSGPGRLSFDVTQSLLTGDPAAATTLLEQSAAAPEIRNHPFIHALQAIVDGSRDRSLAEDPELHYTMAAEILLLIETLEGAAS